MLRHAWGVMLGTDAAYGHPTKDMFVAVCDDDDEGLAAHETYKARVELEKRRHQSARMEG